MDYSSSFLFLPCSFLIGVAVPDTSEFIRQIRYENLGHMDYLVISISPLFIFNWSGCTWYIRRYEFRAYGLPRQIIDMKI